MLAESITPMLSVFPYMCAVKEWGLKSGGYLIEGWGEDSILISLNFGL